MSQAGRMGSAMHTAPAHMSNAAAPNARPTLPAELQRPIIEYALALPPLYIDPRRDDLPGAAWNDWGFHDAGSRKRRTALRRAMNRDALACVRVCKAWKQWSEPFMWAEPYITHRNIRHCVDTLRRRGSHETARCSAPASWIRVLHVGGRCPNQQREPCLSCPALWDELCALALYVQHIAAPRSLGIASVIRLPGLATLLSLQNLQIAASDSDFLQLPQFLRAAPRLELLGIYYGLPTTMHSPLVATNPRAGSVHALVAPALHTLVSVGADPVGQYGSGWDLPALRRLAIVAPTLGNPSPVLDRHHGQLFSLSVSDPVLPQHRVALPACPQLVHLRYDDNEVPACARSPRLVQAGPPSINTALARLAQRCPCELAIRLRALRHRAPCRHDDYILFSEMMRLGAPGPPSIVVDDFQWAQTRSRRRTAEDQAMRGWAAKLRTVGTWLLDGDRQSPPGLEEV